MAKSSAKSGTGAKGQSTSGSQSGGFFRKEVALLVGVLAVCLHYYAEQVDGDLGLLYRPYLDLAQDMHVPLYLTRCFIVGMAIMLLWFFTRSFLRIFVLLLLAGGVGGAYCFLQSPKHVEALVRTLIEAGNIDPKVWEVLKIKDDSVWKDIVLQGNLGIAEAYMHGKADVDPLKFFTYALNGTSIGTRRKEGNDMLSLFANAIGLPLALFAQVFNQQTLMLAKRVTEEHYDAGNDLYEVMLGKSMSYTCAYWKNAKTLDEAQVNKFDLVYNKLELPQSNKGQPLKVLDLGCGWGTLAAHVHGKPGNTEVTGVSLSKEQINWATANLGKPGLKFIWTDWQSHCQNPAHHGVYDRVYSVGMLEHVGYKNHAIFFKCLKKLLKPEGLAVVHTIGEPDFVPISDAFFEKYIFPGAVIPTLSALTSRFENDFILEDFQNFGYDYAPTLAAWKVNSDKFFRDNPKAYSPEFQRMWDYYLGMCEALFRLRINQLWHFVLSPRPATRSRINRVL